MRAGVAGGVRVAVGVRVRRGEGEEGLDGAAVASEAAQVGEGEGIEEEDLPRAESN